MVTQGEGGPSSSASLGTSGSEAGDFWFTQATAGILSFYGVTNKVDSGTDLNTANFATKFPMISFVRYVGETGFGAGTGTGTGTGASSVSELTDVDISSNPPTNGQVLKYNQGLEKWLPGDAGGSGTGGINYGNTLNQLATFNVTEKGQVLETLSGVCDGRSITVSSGTYTLENVTSILQVSTTYVDLTGSQINYKPPTGTKQIIYKFHFHANTDDGSYFLMHSRLYVDGVECTVFRHTAGNHDHLNMNIITFKAVIEIGVENDVENGKFLSWDTQKEIKIMVREYDSGNSAKFHTGTYFDGSATNALYKPSIEIQAIGDKTLTKISNSLDIALPGAVTQEGQVLETLAGVCDGR